jgi:deoxyribodipyrimidine photolyase
MAKKTWVEKRDTIKPNYIEVIDKDFADMKAGEKMLIAAATTYDDYIKQIPKGKSVDMKTMRKDLAIEHNADMACPLVSGIHTRIVAEAAYEEYQAGKPINKITPFWRVVNLKSNTAKKLTFGTDFLKEMRQKEKLEE